MNIIDIENMTAAELKANQGEAVEAVANDEALAQRYVKALLDAKTRDEKLAEQGQTITLLQQAAEQQKAALRELEAGLALARDEAEAERGRALETESGLRNSGVELGRVSGELDQARDLAKRRRRVLAEISNLIAPALAEE